MDHIMTYEEYLRDVKKGIVTDLGNSPVTPLLLMLQGKWKTQITMTIWFVLLSAGIKTSAFYHVAAVRISANVLKHTAYLGGIILPLDLV